LSLLKVGAADGFDVGEIDGLSLLKVGAADEFDVGEIDGLSLLKEGDVLGIDDCKKEGSLDGSSECKFVGLLLFARLGEFVGDVDGLEDFVNVGVAEGAKEGK
jgi:hypothetical protein